jgi:ketosteroid isomerase-like protein
LDELEAARAAVDQLATRLFDAFERSDVAVYDELVAADARFWNPFREIDAQRLRDVLETGEPMVPGLRYDGPQRQVFADASGFVQRHIARGNGPDGAMNLPACVVGLVHDGRLSRLEMYYDTFPVTAVGLGGDREH